MMIRYIFRFAMLLFLLANEVQPFTPAARQFQHTKPNIVRIQELSRLQAFRLDADGSVDPSNNRHAASDWWYNVRSLPKSKVLREVRNPVLAVGLWSFIVSVTHRVFSTHSNSILQMIARHMSIPGTAHSFLVSALGLLLVFRTNSAYQRFYVRVIYFQLAEHLLFVFDNRKDEEYGRTSFRSAATCLGWYICTSLKWVKIDTRVY